MQIYDLITSLMGDYRNRFASLAELINQRYISRAEKADNNRLPVSSTTQSEQAQPVTDSYQPSTVPENALYEPPEAPVATGPEPTETEPETVTSLTRRARLDYQLTLAFDLAAFSRTVTSLSEGDTESVEELAAAGFGLSADFDLRGMQVIKEKLADADNAVTKTHQQDLFKNRGVAAFEAQSRDFRMNAVSREMTSLRRSSDVVENGNMRRAINKFALRYRMDHQFSLAFAQRFRTQVEKVSENLPESVNQYVDTAGDVALKGTTDMMATFFDAVDGYLDQAEAKTLESVASFFSQAAEELGFSGEMVEMVQQQLTGTVESFFDRVEEAVAQMEARFVGESMPSVPPGPPGEAVVGDPSAYIEPDADATGIDKGQLATA